MLLVFVIKMDGNLTERQFQIVQSTREVKTEIGSSGTTSQMT